MEDTTIAYNTSLLAKEKGFTLRNVGSHGYNYYKEDGNTGQVSDGHLYLDNPACVPQSILQKWLREEHNIAIIIIPCYWGEFDTRNGTWEAKLYFLDDMEHKGTKKHDFNDVGFTTKFLECDDEESDDYCFHNLYEKYEMALEDALYYALTKIK